MNLLYTYTYGGYSSNAWYSGGVGQKPYLLKYYYGQTLNTYGKSKTPVQYGSTTVIRIGNGQCVDFAKAMSNTGGISSGDWERGNRVFDDGSITRGTVIATFSDPHTYYGHVAVFDQWHWTYNGGWIVDGFYVWDQNYVSPLLIGKHLLKRSGFGVSNADNYYIVRVP
ncbi:MAG: BPSL0067 family protein [Patescibacteria group bacterium]|nr:BPSL0067 family protein [Patescibacteria group bacterium]